MNSKDERDFFLLLSRIASSTMNIKCDPEKMFSSTSTTNEIINRIDHDDYVSVSIPTIVRRRIYVNMK
jgi:hypothetical protein